MPFPEMRSNPFPSPVHNLMVVEELESENYAGRVKPEIGPKEKKNRTSCLTSFCQKKTKHINACLHELVQI